MEPLIWTKYGNLPLASLRYENAWDNQEDYVKFSERYYNADGEIVKEGAHVYLKKGVTGEGALGGIGG